MYVFPRCNGRGPLFVLLSPFFKSRQGREMYVSLCRHFVKEMCVEGKDMCKRVNVTCDHGRVSPPLCSQNTLYSMLQWLVGA